MTAITIADLNNAKLDVDHIADVATSTDATATDRLGGIKSTVKGAVDSLKAFVPRGAFAGATPYYLKELYTDPGTGITYVTIIDHTSTTIATDLAAGKVTVHQGATEEDLALPSGAAMVGAEATGANAVTRTVQDKLRETITLSDHATFSASLIAASASTIVIKSGEVATISVNTTVPENVSIRVENGGLITVPDGVTLTINGPFDAGLRRAFSDTGSVIFGVGATSVVRPEWWGAIANGVTDCAPAVRKLITCIFASRISTVDFVNGTYYFGTPVVVLFDTYNALRLLGTSTASMMSGGLTGGTTLTGAAGMESIFIFSKTNLGATGGYTFECTHIAFKSSLLGTAGPLRALLNKVGGFPMRPFVVKNCDFRGFSECIVSDLTAAIALNPAITTGICQVIIRENTFTSNNHALIGRGGLNAIMDLDFSDNVSENGGKIHSRTGPGGVGTIGGTISICDNLLEGQEDAIMLDGGLFAATIARNYFEVNSSYIVSVTATNPKSKLVLGPNYITNCPGGIVTVANLQLSCNENYSRESIVFEIKDLHTKSTINNSGVFQRIVGNYGQLSLDKNCVSMLTSLPPSTLTNGQWVPLVGTVEVTPIGSVAVTTIPAGGFTDYGSPTIAYNTGDLIVYQALIRKRSGSGGVYLTVYDNAYATGANSDPSFNVGDVAVGEWVWALFYVKTTSTSISPTRFRWGCNGTASYDVANTYVYKIAAPATPTPISICLPSI